MEYDELIPEMEFDANGENLLQSGYGSEEDGFEQVTYFNSDVAKYSRNGKTLFSCSKDIEGLFEIPEGVELVAAEAFRNCEKITSVRIPATLRNIGRDAFREISGIETFEVAPGNIHFTAEDSGRILCSSDFTSLIKVSSAIGDTFAVPEMFTEVREFAFYGCAGIKKVILPDTVTVVGRNAFADCRKLKDVRLGKMIAKLPGWVFRNCVSLSKIELSPALRRIGTGAFSGCVNLKKIRIPEEVNTIGNDAFADCRSLTEIFIPAKVKNIGVSAFDGCMNLEKFDVDEDNRKFSAEDGLLYNKYQTALLRCPQTKKTAEVPELVSDIEESAFSGCTRLKNIALPPYINQIRNYTFADCISLEEIGIPENVLSIGRGAFENCISLENIKFGGHLRVITDFAFAGCKSLKELSLPDSLTEIGEAKAAGNMERGNTFNGCTSLETLHLPDRVEYLNEYCFCNCKNLRVVTLPRALNYVDKDLFFGCDNLKRVVLRNPETEIEAGAFAEDVVVEVEE